jgi:ankyrin repeat protein
MIDNQVQINQYYKNISSFEYLNPIYYLILNNKIKHIESVMDRKLYYPNQRDLFNYSALHFGVVCNAQPQTIEKLLELGCDPLQKTDGGYTARDIAMATNSNPQIIKLLEKYEELQTAKTPSELSDLSNIDNQPRDPDLLRGASILMELKSKAPCQR